MSERYRSILKIFVLLLVLLIITGIISYMTISHFITGGVVKVPDVTGKNVIEAVETLSPIQLFLVINQKVNSHTIPHGMILNQNPKPNTLVKKNRKVYVVISSGAKNTYVPDVRNKEYLQAGIVLRKSLLEVGKKIEIFSIVYKKDFVISQFPPPGTEITINSTIDLLICKGKPPNQYMLPDFTKKNINKYLDILQELGFYIDYTETEVNNNYPAGTILRQSPVPGTAVNEKDIISFTVSVKGATKKEEKTFRGDYKLIEFTVPQGFFEKRVTIYVKDAYAKQKIFDKRCNPGEKISKGVYVIPPAEVEIYIDNNLYKSGSIE